MPQLPQLYYTLPIAEANLSDPDRPIKAYLRLGERFPEWGQRVRVCDPKSILDCQGVVIKIKEGKRTLLSVNPIETSFRFSCPHCAFSVKVGNQDGWDYHVSQKHPGHEKCVIGKCLAN